MALPRWNLNVTISIMNHSVIIDRWEQTEPVLHKWTWAEILYYLYSVKVHSMTFGPIASKYKLSSSRQNLRLLEDCFSVEIAERNKIDGYVTHLSSLLTFLNACSHATCYMLQAISNSSIGCSLDPKFKPPNSTGRWVGRSVVSFCVTVLYYFRDMKV